LVGSAIGLWSIFTARRYAKRGTCRRRVSVRPPVRPSANNATRYARESSF